MPEDASVESPAAQLNALRVEIDRIDAAMHAHLIERSAIIDQLIGIKAGQGGGSAFRPGREAEMMRRIAERHTGRLPLDTVESIWRVIIATFTFLQSSYAVHADMAGGDAAMRDSARFHFGFTVPLRVHFGVEGVIQAVGQAEGDLGLLRAEEPPSKGVWWESLVPPDAPKIIARLPFVERPDHPAGMPVFVIARPFAAAAARDVLFSRRGTRSMARGRCQRRSRPWGARSLPMLHAARRRPCCWQPPALWERSNSTTS